MLFQHKVTILLGPGGVGKTSTSIGLAIRAAHAGKKVGLLSIDPARRLADALGLNSQGFSLSEIDLQQGQGSLHISMLDQKQIFDHMVYQYAPSRKTADAIIENKLYEIVAYQLAGTLEYMALAKLQDMIDSESFDIIILDTPPDTNALHFLDKPNILAEFYDNKVMNWLIKPFHFASKFGLSKLLSKGENLMGGIAKVTGTHALSLLSEFIMLMQHVIDGFHKAAEEMSQVLKDPSTAFLLITVPEREAVQGSIALGQNLRKLGYPLSGMIVNRMMHPNWGKMLQDLPHANTPEILQIYKSKYDNQQQLLQELESFIQKENPNPTWVKIYEHQRELHSIKAMEEFAQTIQIETPTQ